MPTVANDSEGELVTVQHRLTITLIPLSLFCYFREEY